MNIKQKSTNNVDAEHKKSLKKFKQTIQRIDTNLSIN